LVWKSSDTTVVSVSNTGKLSAKDVGKSTITLTNKANTFSLSGLVSVKDSLNVGLLAYYPFNNSTNDLSGHNFNGVAHNLTSTPDRFGKANAAYSFNGTSSYVKVNDDQQLRLNNTDITLNAWVKLDDYNSSFGNNVLSKHLSGSENGWAWGITGYGFYPTGVLTYGPGGGSASARGAIVIDRNNWHMITSVYNLASQKLSLYVDGVLDGVTYNIPSPNVNTETGLYIGRDNPEVPTNGYFIHGSLDEIRIYNRLLNANTIHKLFVATK
jgi:hypothetical protein